MSEDTKAQIAELVESLSSAINGCIDIAHELEELVGDCLDDDLPRADDVSSLLAEASHQLNMGGRKEAPKPLQDSFD